MDCREVHERLNAYLDRESPPEADALVRAHLSGCPQCASEVAELERLNHAIGSLAGMSVPTGFARRIRKAAERAPIRAGVWSLSEFMAPGRAPARIAAVVMAAVGLALGVAMAGAVSPSEVSAGETMTAELEGFDLYVDPLSAAPSGSVTEVYLAFTAATE